MSYQLTKKEIVKEIVKAGKDPVYFTNNFCRISHPLKGSITFKTYDYQSTLLLDFNAHRFNIILKARQLGISTIVAAYIVWLMLFHRDKNILVMATKFSTASNLVKKVKSMMRNVPEWLKIAEINVDNRTSFELTNGSQIKAISTSPDAGRSEALSLLVIDEAAHVEGLEELWTGLYPTLSTGGRCIALSTPNGVGNWFHKEYVASESQENDFFPTILPWDAHPERDQEWFEKEIRSMSRRQVAQELECNFNTSGDTVLHPDDLARLKILVKEPKYRTGFDRNYWIWEEYDPENTYFVVADVARGDGKDNSTFHIVKLETMEQVAEYQGKPTLDAYANMLNTVGKEYGQCMIVVENIGIGISILEKLIDLEYPNIYYATKSTHEHVDPLIAQNVNNVVPGFTTSYKTRPLIIAKLEEFVRNKLITVYSSRLLAELETFIWDNGKPQAMRGYNDDLTMALAIGCWVKDSVFTINQRSVEYSKVMLDSMFVAGTKISTAIEGQHGYNKSFDHDKNTKTKEKIDAQKEFIWLLKG